MNCIFWIAILCLSRVSVILYNLSALVCKSCTLFFGLSLNNIDEKKYIVHHDGLSSGEFFKVELNLFFIEDRKNV